MENLLIETALTQSIWAGLALGLIFYILKKQEARDAVQASREEKYQRIIWELTNKLSMLETLHQDLKEIKKNLPNLEG